MKQKPAFEYLRGKFPRLNEAKVKEGVVDGPQVQELQDDAFVTVVH
jgi:hypothetical protein